MNEAVINSISKMIVSGNRMDLPKDEHFGNYAQVKKTLVAAGGKYKKNGFDFTVPAQDIYDRLVGGEEVNDKKKFQFFATPPELVKELVSLAGVHDGQTVLEPSAGHGAIADEVIRKDATCIVVELMEDNLKVLREKCYNPISGNFLEMSTELLGFFDHVIANPPFTKNQDIDHIKHMYKFLKPGGSLTTIASQSWLHGSQRKQTQFKGWVESLDSYVGVIDKGAFKSSGTQVGVTIIKIVKEM